MEGKIPLKIHGDGEKRLLGEFVTDVVYQPGLITTSSAGLETGLCCATSAARDHIPDFG
jgi:hypothetical protein